MMRRETTLITAAKPLCHLTALLLVVLFTRYTLLVSSAATSTPRQRYHPDTVYATAVPWVYALNLSTGAVRWKWGVGGTQNMQHTSRLTSDASLLLVPDTRTIRALDTITGHEVWSYISDSQAHIATTPAVTEDDGVVFGTWDNDLIRLWPNGTFRWRAGPFDGGGGTFQYVVPAIDEEGIIYHATYLGAVVAVAPLNGSVLWRTELPYQATSSVALGASDTLYVSAGGMVMVALHRNNGSTAWATRYSTVNQEGLVTGTPAVRPTDGTIIVESMLVHIFFGVVTAIAPNGHLLWNTTELDDYIGCTVAATNDLLYLTTGDSFYGLNSTGHVVWRQPTTPDTADEAGLVPLSNGVVIAVDSYAVFALNASTGVPIWNFTTFPTGSAFHIPVLCPCLPPSDESSCLLSCL